MLTTSGPGGIFSPASTKLYPTASGQGAPARPARQGRYDCADFSPSPGGERRHYLDLASRLSNEVRTATTTGDIQVLRTQLREEAYAPDPMAIAAKMLLMEEKS